MAQPHQATLVSLPLQICKVLSNGYPMASLGPPETSASDVTDSTVFERLENHPWDADAEFQHGLQSILSSGSSPEQRKNLTLRAKCFYYARKIGTSIDPTAYRDWRERRVTASDSLANGNIAVSDTQAAPSNDDRNTAMRHETSGTGDEPPAPYPNTFSQIVELISTGQPIPGIKEIPETVLEGQASQAVAGKRRKPWEKGEVITRG